MARRRVTPSQTPERARHEVIQRPMDEVMHLSMLPYAEHVILERALPRVEDGLKPVQRRILFTLNELGVTPDKPHKKCARIVGDCLGKYHPHGDSSVYDALVRLAQPYSMRGLLVDGHGNFGSIDGDTAAAMRYTEARMAPLALEMLRDIDKDTVPFSFNFDDTLKEPDVLPSRYPNLLVNGTSGIAVGIATNIPPHNLRETIDAALLVMEKPKATLDEILNVLPGPDFPTGGCLVQSDEIRNAYQTGKGKLILRARAHVEEGNAGRKLIVITEIPYQVSKSAMLEHILKLTEDKKTLFGGIYDIRDESDRSGMRAVIELRKDVEPLPMLAALYKYSDMQVTFGVNMFAIAEGRPMLMGVKELLQFYIDHQKRVLTRRTQFELEHARAREHILAGLMVAVNHLDEVIAIIRKSKTPKMAKEQLENRFGLTEVQAQAILDLRLQRLTGLEIEALRKEYQQILETIARLEGILGSERRLMQVIRKEMTEIRERFGDERRTSIVVDEMSDLPIQEEKKPSEEACVLLMRDGQLRRMTPKAAAKPLAQENGWEEVEVLLQTRTDRQMAVFTNLGTCLFIDVTKVPEIVKPKDRGSMLNGLVHGIQTDERIVALLDLEALLPEQELLFVTQNGQVKRTDLSEYRVRRAKVAAISLKKGDEVVAVLPVAKQDAHELVLVTKAAYSIRFKLDEVPTTGRVTAGVRGIALGDGDCVLSAFVPEQGMTLFVLSDRGYGKRILASDIDRQSRSGKGQRVLPFTRANSAIGSELAACLMVREDCTKIACVQKHGGVTRFSPAEILVERRTTSGSLLINVLMDDIVVAALVSERQKP